PPDFAASLSALHVRSLPTRRSADLDREGVDHALVQRVQPPGETAEDRDDNADDDDDQQGNLCSAHRPLRRLPMSRRAMPGVCGIGISGPDATIAYTSEISVATVGQSYLRTHRRAWSLRRRASALLERTRETMLARCSESPTSNR